MFARSRTTVLALSCSALLACSSEPEPAPPPSAPLPEKALQEVAEGLVRHAKVPGAILGVVHGNQRWVGAAGFEDLDGTWPLTRNRKFRAASITKMFTALLVMRAIEGGTLKPDDKLASFRPDFPNASAITVDALLSHTGGVTTDWFDKPALQTIVAKDLSHVFTPDEALSILEKRPPDAPPASAKMRYSNTDYVLLGELVSTKSGLAIGDLMKRDIFDAIPLPHTTFQFSAPAGLMSGWYEYQGLTLDMATVPQEALVSFAGAAGAVHSTVDDLLTFGDAVFRSKKLINAASLAHMMTPAEAESWYAHGLMRFCPCDDGIDGTHYTGWGHAGNLPGYWSEVVYYPDEDVLIAAVINRDIVNGAPLDHTVFNEALSQVLSALH